MPKPRSTICSVNGCGEEKIPGNSRCRAHYNAYMREYRKEHRTEITATEYQRRARKGYDPSARWGYRNSRAGSNPRYSPPVEGPCPICGEIKLLIQDHNHVSGLFRDRICSRCNVIVGPLADDLELLKVIVAYADRWHRIHGDVETGSGEE